MTDQEKMLVQVWREEVADDKKCSDSDQTILSVINIVEVHHPGTIAKLHRMIDVKRAAERREQAR